MNDKRRLENIENLNFFHLQFYFLFFIFYKVIIAH